MSQKSLSDAMNDFVNVLVEQELEPIRLDLIRVENDAKEALEEIQQKTEKDFKEAIAEVQEKLDEITETMRRKEEEEPKPSVDDEKFYILKEAIENLAVKASDALAEGFSEQEEQYTKICGELDGKISALDRKFTQTATEIQEVLEEKIAELESKLTDSSEQIHENLNGRISAIEKKFNF